LVNQEEHSVISGDALPEIGLPAETTFPSVTDRRMEREQAPALQRPDQTEGDFDRPSSVQILSRLASNAKLFRSADGRFCPS
jgi:hypothetical protein